MTRFTAIYDACVLYPAPLRDFLLQLACSGLFRARWTDAIHDEWIRNLLEERPDLDPAALTRTRQLMDRAVPDCLIEDYEALIQGISLPDPNDRHVLAAAIRGHADVVVTFNLDDFPSKALASYGIEAQHPDEFIGNLIDLAPEAICLSAKICRERLRKPPLTVQEYIDCLARQQLTSTSSFLERNAALI